MVDGGARVGVRAATRVCADSRAESATAPAAQAMRFWRSPVGWAFAALYLVAFVLEYVDYLHRRGTWFADLGLDLLAMPYVLVGRVLTMSATFELHGFQPWGLVPAALFCAFL